MFIFYSCPAYGAYGPLKIDPGNMNLGVSWPILVHIACAN